MSDQAFLNFDPKGLTHLGQGKVRELFDLGNQLLIVATDRISAFDIILPNGIPQKGEVLTQISDFWFERTRSIVPNHRQDITAAAWPEQLAPYGDALKKRAVVVQKATPLPIECVVRGYLAGSGWKEYRQNGTVCQIPLPPDLAESAELPELIFTPAIKAMSGHDENISFEHAATLVGKEIADQVRKFSLALYHHAREFALKKGIIIADTKFEFGLWNGELVLIDEVLTPDSSRFWLAANYQPGRPQESFDKQFVRDYLESLDWDKTEPGPELPDEIVDKTRSKYIEAYETLTGESL
ncbi:MAG: Phosphoribosylaminoimidazole-succinocarboxamide synthase [Verrucomicrobia subdivision 3 bacterium]|nr:Phosphoribosylaminoimidazole-succinocarboxamide synthase [Limisphaerales bacterium]MCS1413631.1 Phosphoribosylaminoimidazole-succinocarboxamide synthase [Limisphaerales bacterium]